MVKKSESEGLGEVDWCSCIEGRTAWAKRNRRRVMRTGEGIHERGTKGCRYVIVSFEVKGRRAMTRSNEGRGGGRRNASRPKTLGVPPQREPSPREALLENRLTALTTAVRRLLKVRTEESAAWAAIAELVP